VREKIFAIGLVMGFVSFLMFRPGMALEGRGAENLIPNGSFETDADGDGAPDGWRLVPTDGVTCSLDHLVKHSGRSSLKLSSDSREGKAEAAVWPPVAVKPATQYCLNYFIKGKGLECCRNGIIDVAVYGLDKSTGGVPKWTRRDTWRRPDREETLEWRRRTLRFTTGQHSEAILILLQFFGCAGTVWFDDISLVEMPDLKPEGTNLLPNPGFETDFDSNRIPDEWERISVKNGARISLDEQNAHCGMRCLLLEQSEPVKVDASRSVYEWSGFALAAYGHKRMRVKGGKRYLPVLWFRAEGLKPERRPGGYAAFQIVIFWEDAEGRRINTRMQKNSAEYIYVDSPQWTEIRGLPGAAGVATGYRQPETAPEGAVYADFRLALATATPGTAPKVWVDDVQFIEMGDGDNLLSNGGFEEGDGSVPSFWKRPGRGKWQWARGISREGERSVMVQDAPSGQPSTWEVSASCCPFERYSLSAYVRTQDVLPNGLPRGACLFVTFFSGERRLATSLQSEAVAGTSDWTRLALDFTVPEGATRMRIGVGMSFSGGKAWFDSVKLHRTGSKGSEEEEWDF